MRYLNFSNAEELIFQNQEIQRLLPPYFAGFFEQWKLGKRVPVLKQLSKTAIIDLLNQLKDQEIKVLEDYFGERFLVEKLNYNIVENITIPLQDEEICKQLCDFVGFNNFAVWRDETQLYISFWR